MERGKLKRVHYVSNLSTALKFLESKRVNIASFSYFIQKNLLWSIFQPEEESRLKVFADEKVNVAQKIRILLRKFKKICGKMFSKG